MVAAYTNLATDLPQGDMYDVAYTNPVEVVLPRPLVEFGAVLQDVAKRLLLLNGALCNLHRSYVRAQATEAALAIISMERSKCRRQAIARACVWGKRCNR